MNVGASFDKHGMRNIEDGICQMPLRKNLILSLSKDAQTGMQQRFAYRPCAHRVLSHLRGARRTV